MLESACCCCCSDCLDGDADGDNIDGCELAPLGVGGLLVGVILAMLPAVVLLLLLAVDAADGGKGERRSSDEAEHD